MILNSILCLKPFDILIVSDILSSIWSNIIEFVVYLKWQIAHFATVYGLFIHMLHIILAFKELQCVFFLTNVKSPFQ